MTAIGTTFTDTVGLALIGMSAILFVVIAAQFFLRSESRQLFLSGQPLPNIFVGWLLLWMSSSALLLSYPFPTADEMNPIRVAPPGMELEVVVESEEGGEEGDEGDNGAIDLMVSNGCGGCHKVEGVSAMQGMIGPELTTVGSVALERLEDSAYSGAATNASEYIEESILHPDVYVMADYPLGVMPATFDSLPPEDLQTMVEYLTSRE
jgi:mono/diheme cytochrome c family protein